jgi:hypothetical protein
MATAPECIARFEREDLFLTSPVRMGRALREQGSDLWPSSPIGGGANAPHVEPRHLVNFLLAQAGGQPSEAAVAVAALRELTQTDYQSLRITDPANYGPKLGFQHVDAADGVLGRNLELNIAAAASPEVRARLTAVDEAPGSLWSLVLCADDPAWATLTVCNYDTVATIVYGDRKHAGRRSQLMASIPLRAIIVAGELYQDTKTRTENADPSPKGPALSTAPTAQKQQAPKQVDATARVRASATPGGSHDDHRRRPRSPARTTRGAA